MSKEAMKLALEALTKNSDRVTEIRMKADAIKALEEALKQEQDAPVGLTQEYVEGQWWIEELDAMVIDGAPDQKRAVAVVHRLLKELNAHPKQEQGEPVAKVCHDLDGHIGWNPSLTELPNEGAELYTTPQQRTWVGLTDEEIEMIESGIGYMGKSVTAIIKEAVAKLKEKNT